MNFTKRTPSFKTGRATTFEAGDTTGIALWIKERQSEMNRSNLVYGRIRDTGVNYIVEGFALDPAGATKWVTIPCRRLLDARLYLAKVMDKGAFDLLKATR